MPDDLDKLLKSAGLIVPEDFTMRVLNNLDEQPQNALLFIVVLLLRVAAACAAVAFGISEIIAAIFSAWAMTAAF